MCIAGSVPLTLDTCGVCSLAGLVCGDSALRDRGSPLSRSRSGAAVGLENDARQKLYLYTCV